MPTLFYLWRYSHAGKTVRPDRYRGLIAFFSLSMAISVYSAYYNLADMVDRFDVLIDFTRPDPSMEFIEVCHWAGQKFLIGGTGYTDDQRKVIAEA